MYLIFVDECGYQPNWSDEQAILDQPFHVVAAVAILASYLPDAYTAIRTALARLNLPDTEAEALGKGEEIKASQVDRGEGFWGKKQTLRDGVRRIYLDLKPVKYFVVCIDKQAHKQRYSQPEDPSKLSLRFLLERLQGFLQAEKQVGYILIDLNKRQEADQRGFFRWLLLRGSSGLTISRLYDNLYEWKLEMSKVIEIHFGDSKYSLGLQIADFVARHAYSWRKNNKDRNYPGWSFIEPRLYKYPAYQGWGYKEFPGGTP